jgi:hypothetical protein
MHHSSHRDVPTTDFRFSIPSLGFPPAVVDFELFRRELEAASARSDRPKGCRPPF